MIVNPLSLEGKRMLVTGASSGIGRATAELCSRLGAQLICLGRDEHRLHETLAAMAGEHHSSYVADVDDADALSRLVQSAVEKSGPLAGIVHSAGMQHAVPLRIAKSDDFLRQYRTNALSAAQLLSAVARRGVASPDGCSVVLVGSVMSVLGAAGLAAYCSSKAAFGPGPRCGRRAGCGANPRQRGVARRSRYRDVTTVSREPECGSGACDRANAPTGTWKTRGCGQCDRFPGRRRLAVDHGSLPDGRRRLLGALG